VRGDFLCLPYPVLLPNTRSQIADVARTLSYSGAIEPLFDSELLKTEYISAVPVESDDEEHVEHDRYFRVVRVTDRPAHAFVGGLLRAHSSVYGNGQRMGVALLDPVEWRELFAGLDAILRYAAGDRLKEGASVSVSPAPRQRPDVLGGPDEYDPELRWLIGHQLFFALLQGVIVGLNCAAGPDDEADVAMRVAAAFMRSSAAAIKFTSDFGPVDYEERIRPAMSPPSVRAGFSGLQTRDHAHLVGLFGQLRATAASCPGAGTAFEEFVEATVMAYEAHKHICARFGGDVLPSLRMAAASRGRTAQAGVTALRQLMRSRLFALTRDGDG
jgi:hypothetical protein